MPSTSGSPERAQYGRERSKAAAWAWYERGGAATSGGSLCRQAGSSTALMVRGKYMQRISIAGNSRRLEHQDQSSSEMDHVEPKASKRHLPPSRFKEEADKLAAASRQRWGSDACPQSSCPDEEEVACSNHGLSGSCQYDAAHATHISISSPNQIYTPSARLPSTSSSHPPPAFLHHAAVLDDPPPHPNSWLDSLFGISSRKSTSSFYVDNELASLISLFGQSTKAAISHRSSLFDSFELQAMLRKLVPHEGDGHHPEPQGALDPEVEEQAVVADVREAHDHGSKEAQYTQALVELAAHDKQELKEYFHIDQVQKQDDLEPLVRKSSPMAGNMSGKLALDSRHSMSTGGESAEEMPGSDGHDGAPSVAASHNRQTLHDLLQWSPHSSNWSFACECASEMVSDNDDYYYSESPDLSNMSTSCNNISCDTKSAQRRRRRRRRRPSLLMPRLPNSFSNALHHLPNLPHSVSNALHHLPHSLSNALHHLPRIPHSLSNAFHQIAHLTHSLSSAYRHHVASHRGSAGHNMEASPFHDAHVHAQKQNHIPSHLHQLYSFKMHHSSPSPDIVAVGGTSPTANCQSLPSSPGRMQLMHNYSKSPSPCRERRLSASSDYMLLYSSAKKHSSKGIVHHHHHHHYHHYHYILPEQENL